jgi:hypothetical protein
MRRSTLARGRAFDQRPASLDHNHHFRSQANRPEKGFNSMTVAGKFDLRRGAILNQCSEERDVPDSQAE